MILILAVTGSGKGALAFELAKHIGAEIISIDSMKVYRRMDIGTAKPPLQRRSQITHHLIDVLEPSQSFSVEQFLTLAKDAQKDIKSRKRQVVAAGGTAMYIKALLFGIFEGVGTDLQIREKLTEQANSRGLAHLHDRLKNLDPDAAEKIHPNDAKRIIRALEVYELTSKPISSFQNQFDSQKMLENWTVIGLRREKKVESQRINARVKKMIDMGLVDEVRSLLDESPPISPQAASAIGYAEIIEHLKGEMTLDQAVEKIKINTRRLAKSQRTWFKTFRFVNWVDIDPDDTTQKILQKVLEKI